MAWGYFPILLCETQYFYEKINPSTFCFLMNNPSTLYYQKINKSLNSTFRLDFFM